MSELERRKWGVGEEAEWIADKVCALGDYGKDAARMLRKQVTELSAITAERDALKARIDEAEKQYPIAWRAYDRQGWWIVGATKQDALDRCGRGDDRRCEPLYAAPIPSPDTQEDIRKAVEEEREACAKICDAQASEWDSDSVQTYKNYAGFCSSAIRSRSTKEK